MIPPDLLEKLTQQAGGRFRLTAMLQKRAREICLGAPSLFGAQPDRPMEVALREAAEGKLYLVSPEEAGEEETEETEE